MEFVNGITIENVVFASGILILAFWLVRTSLGKKALADSVPRRNDMPAFMPFVPLFIWFGIVSVAASISRELFNDLQQWQVALLDNIYLCVGAIAAAGVIIFLARRHFARRLKGFGLNPKTIHRDFFAAVLNLLGVWPLVMLAIVLTTLLGKLLWGADFSIQQHHELELITVHRELSVRVLIIITTVAVVPAFEEMLFRGMFQTMIRSFVLRPWLSILISSGLFAVIHPDKGHWPALFVLSVCLGYSYEKSNSLFRPIFIHSLFNAASVIAVLSQ